MKDVQELILKIRESDSLTPEQAFDFAKQTSILLRSDDTDEVEQGRNLIINALDHLEKIPDEMRTIWSDLIESCGFYPYLEKEKSKLGFSNFAGEIRKAIHHSDSLHGKYLHEEQLRALQIFDSGKNLIVSAPTSFGKSLLIEEIVARKTFKNIIIIQPTLALLDETRKNLKKYKDHYRLIIKTSQKPAENGNNIFLFTAERVMEYQDFPKIDVLIIDEFYKLSTYRKDDRADTLNVAFYKILKNHSPQFYLLGPNIDSVSEKFTKAFNAVFFKTNYSLVTADVISLYDKYQDRFSKPRINKEFIEEILFKTLLDLKDQQTLIYCSSPERTREISKKFLAYLKKHTPNTPKQSLSLIDWMKENIHRRWTLCECLEYGIGVHDAALPRHVSSSIIHEFNKSKVKYLFCTSTIIEGVNTSAKNIILFDKKRGGTAIDYFDYSNIKGRAGRLMVHYVGRIFNFHPEPKPERVDIDFPFFDQKDDTSKEILIQVAQEDVENKKSDNYQELMGIPSDQREIFKKNGVSVSGQKKILDQLIADLKTQPELIVWTNFPKWEQLVYAIKLGSTHLKNPKESMGYSANKFAFLVNKYAHQPEIIRLVINEHKYLVEKNPDASKVDLLDDAVRLVFQFQRHWLEYALPKWFHVINSLQEYACIQVGIKPGNYTFFASSLENDFINPRLTFLLEMGVPRSAVHKIEKSISDSVEQEDQIISFVRKNLNRIEFTEYERERLNDL